MNFFRKKNSSKILVTLISILIIIANTANTMSSNEIFDSRLIPKNSQEKDKEAIKKEIIHGKFTKF